MVATDWMAELAARRRAVWEVAQGESCDAVLIFGSQAHAEPFRYLTNFVPVLGDMWGLLTGPEAMTCILNFSWQLAEAAELSGLEGWAGHLRAAEAVVRALGQGRPQRLGVVGLNRMPVTDYQAIRTALPGMDLVDIGGPVAVLRRRKSPLEAGLLREAARITDIALERIRQELRPGLTEYEVAARLGAIIQGLGAEMAFPPCVVSGVDKPIPIRMPTGRRLQPGDSIMIDMGAALAGYQADAARTFVLGSPSAAQQRVWETIRRAYDAALQLARPGVSCLELHRAAVGVIEQEGYPLVHRIGHGIGLATSFEWPSLDTEPSPLLPGMAICIEPGIYVPGAGNMKLEDDLLITENGCEVLTRASHDLIVPV